MAATRYPPAGIRGVALLHRSNRYGTVPGHLGNPGHAEVQAAIQTIFASARQRRRSVGILAPEESAARRYLEHGASFVAVGSDQGLLRAATQELRERFG